jgi:hypothetical protein
MSGAPSREVLNEARAMQESRIVSSDLSIPLDKIIGMYRLEGDALRYSGFRIIKKNDNPLHMRYQISNDNLLQYVYKYISYHKMTKVAPSKSVISDLMSRTRVCGKLWIKSKNPMTVPGSRNSTERGYYIEFIGSDENFELFEEAKMIFDDDAFFKLGVSIDSVVTRM